MATSICRCIGFLMMPDTLEDIIFDALRNADENGHPIESMTDDEWALDIANCLEEMDQIESSIIVAAVRKYRAKARAA